MGRLLINIAKRTGFHGAPLRELMDINRADVGLVRGAIARNRDVVVGVKARLSEDVAGTNDLEGLRRAQEAPSSFNLPLMIHIGSRYGHYGPFSPNSNAATSSLTCTLRRRIPFSTTRAV